MIRTGLPHVFCLSPNVEPRPHGVWPDVLLYHYTGMESADAARRWLCAQESRVSCHYLVDEAGEITQMVGEEMRAWHAGNSCWRGVTDINSHSIGIEIHNPGHTRVYSDFPAVQMEAVAKLSLDILSRHEIPAHNVLAHSDVAPKRKIDPGEKFDWQGLHAVGIGHWVRPVAPSEPAVAFSVDNRAIQSFQEKLLAYGYNILPTGQFDSQTEIVTRAFQRHFRPQRVDGIADASTAETLDRLLQTCPR